MTSIPDVNEKTMDFRLMNQRGKFLVIVSSHFSAPAHWSPVIKKVRTSKEGSFDVSTIYTLQFATMDQVKPEEPERFSYFRF